MVVRARIDKGQTHTAQRIGDDGLLHRSSVDNELMITLFQRSNDSFPKRPDFNELLTDPACDPVILEACRTLNYTVV
ncbi:hypothetical protein OVA26_17030 [Microbacterium sp. SL62]|uniref:hypothetical protein n=1 Tax=Microbacterium sp. SL62 TaxID=2995139 RepID=UPI002273A12E|nr:hypothetical protein [Microbacterium sp. SL62]MCY1718644.1 hypothetical protein [Microbacterium sp. SL62]